MTTQCKKAIVDIARQALYRHFGEKPTVGVRIEDYPELSEKAGVFISIYMDDELRGCIGHIEADMPLANIVAEMAVHAATQDPRFNPIEKNELPDVRFEISVLSPMELTIDFTTIKVGEHGLFIQVGEARGLLLPQVATRYEWTTEEFLRETCRKAQLPEDAYTRSDAKVSKFSAQIIKE
ncbi:MAG: AmmeMemoRadiSam system protein A [Candidatus Marinimicrobia bacterium]|nr:AmmeMemoRadiSam system protein A [Candidatus Neomarinimicrobiota bacterium]MCF7880214.1 AmmeMemoRadiSam system protein A [Candidatus Neomarinimicrobiota bacterium]